MICEGLSEKEHIAVQKDEIRFYYDVLADNSISNICKETGVNIHFISRVIFEIEHK